MRTYAKDLTREELRAMGIYFVEPGGVTVGIGGSADGSDACYELALPKVNDLAAFAKAIDDYITAAKPESPFAGLGSDIVQGSVKQGINPMFVVGNMRMESQYGTSGTTGSPYALEVQLHNHFNAFGRRGGESTGFPQQIGPDEYRKNANTGDIIYWYNYPSWKDSVNSPTASPSNTTDQPSAMRKIYLDDGLKTIGQYLGRYAPASDGNDESVYGKVMKEVIGGIAQLAGAALSCADNTTTATPTSSGTVLGTIQNGRTITDGATGLGTVALGSYKASVRGDYKSYMTYNENAPGYYKCVFDGTQPPDAKRAGYEQVGAKQLQGMLKARFGDNGGNSLLNCGNPPSKHAEGRAIDFYSHIAVPDQLRAGNQALGWVIANAQALGVQYAKFWKIQWTPGRGIYCVTTYDQQYQHRSHVHVDLNWDGSLAKTSGFNGGSFKSPVKIEQEICQQLYPKL